MNPPKILVGRHSLKPDGLRSDSELQRQRSFEITFIAVGDVLLNCCHWCTMHVYNPRILVKRIVLGFLEALIRRECPHMSFCGVSAEMLWI